jgi:hypothetical protein
MADIAGDDDTALELLSINAYDFAVLDRDIPGPTGDEIAKCIVAEGSGMPILLNGLTPITMLCTRGARAGRLSRTVGSIGGLYVSTTLNTCYPSD